LIAASHDLLLAHGFFVKVIKRNVAFCQYKLLFSSAADINSEEGPK